VGIAAALFVAAAAPLTAQEAPANGEQVPRPAPTQTPHPFGQMRLGVVSFTPTLQLRNVGFDNNVFDRTGTERQFRDFTATIDPGIDTRFTTPRLDALVSSVVQLVYYHTYATERAVNPMAGGNADYRLSSALSLYGRGGIGYTKERTGFEIDNRPRRLTQSAVAGAEFGERKIVLDLHAAYADESYDPDALFQGVNLSKTMNRTDRGVGGGVRYRLTPYTSLTSQLDATAIRFEFSPVRNTNSYLGMLGVEFHPRAIISGTAGIGYRVLSPDSTITPRFSGFTPRVGLTYTLRDMLTVSAGAQRDVEFSAFSDRPYFFYRLYEGSIRQAMFHQLDIGASLQYTTLDYQRFGIDGILTEPLPSEVVRMSTVSLGVPILRKARAAWYVQQWERVSTERPYRTVRVGFEISVGKVSVSPRGVFLSGPGR